MCLTPLRIRERLNILGRILTDLNLDKSTALNKLSYSRGNDTLEKKDVDNAKGEQFCCVQFHYKHTHIYNMSGSTQK